jgi:hypothetical protein
VPGIPLLAFVLAFCCREPHNSYTVPPTDADAFPVSVAVVRKVNSLSRPTRNFCRGNKYPASRFPPRESRNDRWYRRGCAVPTQTHGQRFSVVVLFLPPQTSTGRSPIVLQPTVAVFILELLHESKETLVVGPYSNVRQFVTLA